MLVVVSYMMKKYENANRTARSEWAQLKGMGNMALHELGKLKIGFRDGGFEFGWGDKALQRLNLRKKTESVENDYDDYQESGEGIDSTYTGRFAAAQDDVSDDYADYDDNADYAEDSYEDEQYADDDRYEEDDRYADNGQYEEDYAPDDRYADDEQYYDRYASDDQYDDGYADDRYAEDDSYNDDGYADDDSYNDDGYADDDSYNDDGYADDDEYASEDDENRFGDVDDDYGYEYPANFLGTVLRFMDETDWLTYVLLVLLPPVGIWLLWRRQKYELNTRYIASGVSGLWFIVILIWLGLKIFSPVDVQSQPNVTLPSPSPTVEATVSADPTIAADATIAPSASATVEPAATPIGGSSSEKTTTDLVWLSATGMYYHTDKDCSLIDSSEVVSQTTLETATSRGKYACPECYNLEIFYATSGGKWYHKDKTCSQMTDPQVYSKEAAEATGHTACPTCNGGVVETTTAPTTSGGVFITSDTTDKSGINVWANPSGKYYHVTSTCSNMKDAQNISLATALYYGKTACPTCCAASGTIVYCHENGTYYHRESTCSETKMKNGTAVTLAEALVLGKSACPSCLGSTADPGTNSNQSGDTDSNEYYVYANPNGKYYHTRSSCGSMTSAERVTLKSMIEEGREPCPDCASGASMTVYAQSGGRYYHSYATCSGMTNAQQGTLASALAYGLQRCTKCWGTNESNGNNGNESNGNQGNDGEEVTQTENLTPFNATADNVMVWARADGSYYHTKKNCGTLTDPSYISLRVAVNAGKQPCPNCASAATQMVFSTEDGKNYHTIADCRGMKNADRRTLAEAMMLGQTACEVCINLKVEDQEGDPGEGNDGYDVELTPVGNLTVGTSGIDVYASPSDDHFHLNRSCSNATASLSHVALETALNYGRTPCSRCASAAGTTVYATANGKYYHASSSCAGGGASKGTLALAVAMGFKPCPYCVLNTNYVDEVDGVSGVKVYASASDSHYHLSASHAGESAQYVTLETARKYNKTACDDCAAIGNVKVYAAPNNPYYHVSESCAGSGAVSGTYDDALIAGLKPCPYCIGGQSQATPVPTSQPDTEYDAPAETTVYVDMNSDQYYYHRSSSCSGMGMTGGTGVTLEFVKDLGYSRCPFCNPASGISE